MSYEIRCYKISWGTNSEMYVGSTKQTLSKRATAHRRDAKNGKMRNICEAIRKYGRFQYVMLESCMVNSNDEKRMREQKWIDELKPSLNMRRAFSSEEQRMADVRLYRARPEFKAEKAEYSRRPEVKAKLAEYFKEYEAKNIREKRYACDACQYYARDQSKLTRHKKSQKHKNRLSIIIPGTSPPVSSIFG